MKEPSDSLSRLQLACLLACWQSEERKPPTPAKQHTGQNSERWRRKAPAGCCCPEKGEETAPTGRPRRERGLGKSPGALWD
ncbi:Hypothetical predicted protein [Scomber scombrus]|uniref:Uncharacterized protein n=1 Tax=Scomber scombrus TaxID=13677 RepID=A0AAV1N0W2_SCOSC